MTLLLLVSSLLRLYFYCTTIMMMIAAGIITVIVVAIMTIFIFIPCTLRRRRTIIVAAIAIILIAVAADIIYYFLLCDEEEDGPSSNPHRCCCCCYYGLTFGSHPDHGSDQHQLCCNDYFSLRVSTTTFVVIATLLPLPLLTAGGAMMALPRSQSRAAPRNERLPLPAPRRRAAPGTSGQLQPAARCPRPRAQHPGGAGVEHPVDLHAGAEMANEQAARPDGQGWLPMDAPRGVASRRGPAAGAGAQCIRSGQRRRQVAGLGSAGRVGDLFRCFPVVQGAKCKHVELLVPKCYLWLDQLGNFNYKKIAFLGVGVSVCTEAAMCGGVSRPSPSAFGPERCAWSLDIKGGRQGAPKPAPALVLGSPGGFVPANPSWVSDATEGHPAARG